VLQKATFKVMLISAMLLQGTTTGRESQQSWAMVIKMLLWKLNIKCTITQLIAMHKQKCYLKKTVLATEFQESAMILPLCYSNYNI